MRLHLLSLGCVFLIVSSPGHSNSVQATTTTTQNQFSGFVDGGGGGANESLSPMKRLSESLRIAKEGNVDEAFEFARETAHLQAVDRLFSVKYIETLVKISKLADEELVASVLNEAIKKVNSLKTMDSYAGSGDAETAYHFMVAVGGLARETELRYANVAAKLKLCQGSIARNLKNNAMYPRNALESLSHALISEAQGHAFEGKLDKALSAIAVASDLGYCKFDQLLVDPVLAELEDQEALHQHVEKLEQAYLVKVKEWSRSEIDKFQPFVFEFNVDDVEGGSFANGNFEDKILVVDFWATWCQPCCEGIPHFVKLQKELGDDGVQVLGISMDSPDDPNSSIETVKEFLKDKEVNYPCGMGTNALTQRIPGDVKLPTTLFIDRDGNVRYMATGYHDYAKIAALAETLENEGHSVRTPDIH